MILGMEAEVGCGRWAMVAVWLLGGTRLYIKLWPYGKIVCQ